MIEFCKECGRSKCMCEDATKPRFKNRITPEMLSEKSPSVTTGRTARMPKEGRDSRKSGRKQ